MRTSEAASRPAGDGDASDCEGRLEPVEEAGVEGRLGEPSQITEGPRGVPSATMVESGKPWNHGGAWRAGRLGNKRP